MILEGMFPREIYLHTSSSRGRREMYELLYTARPDGTVLYNGPVSAEVLAGIAAGAAGK
ncbi:hypothetical protein D3C74_458140 [compost metagenome]